MSHQIGLRLKAKNQESTYDKCILICCHLLHANKKKYKIKYLHDINPQLEQIMRHKKGVQTVCKV